MGVKLTGADAVRRAVEALGVGMADAVEEATVKAGNRIMADARKNAPVGRRAQARTLKAHAKAGGRTAGGGKARSSPGELRRSIQVRSSRRRDATIAEIYTACDHAVYVEFGTGQRGDPSAAHRADWAGMPAQPYLRPAVDDNVKTVRQGFNQAILAAARRIAKK